MNNFPPASFPPNPAPNPSPLGPPVYSAGSVYHGNLPAPPYYGETPSDAGPLNSLDPLRLLAIARKKWLTILLAVLFVEGAAIFYLSKAPRIYQSRATIELSVRRPRILNKQEAMIEDPSAMLQIEDTLNTQIEKFKGKAMLPHVMASYRVLYPRDALSDNDLASRLSGWASFSMMRHTRLVQVTFMSLDPEFAIQGCNAYAAGAEASTRAENKAVSDAAVAWLEAQASAQKNELEIADQALLDARQKFQMDVMSGQRKTVESALLGFNLALVEIESRAALEKKMLEAFNALEMNPEEAGKLPANIPQAIEVAAALERWRAVVTARDALLSRYTPAHPEVAAQDKAVALYREQALAALNRAKTTAAANLALYEEQTDSLRKKKKNSSSWLPIWTTTSSMAACILPDSNGPAARLILPIWAFCSGSKRRACPLMKTRRPSNWSNTHRIPVRSSPARFASCSWPCWGGCFLGSDWRSWPICWKTT